MQVTNSWLPAQFRATVLKAEGAPVHNLHSAEAQPAGIQENNLRMLEKLNQRHRVRYPHESALESRIQNFELAARMQLRASQELDLSNETEATHKMYGLDDPTTESYGRQLLLARRLVERGVRFVQVLAPGPHNVWDHHGGLKTNLPKICRQTDLPSAGLITDLRQRGMLDDTLVIWGGEFGRTIYCQGALTKTNYGRDHHPKCFSIWMAGGGIQGGVVHGETDDFSYNITKDPVHIRDLNATILHLLGIDHERFTYPFKGLDQRLTGVEESRIVSELLA